MTATRWLLIAIVVFSVGAMSHSDVNDPPLVAFKGRTSANRPAPPPRANVPTSKGIITKKQPVPKSKGIITKKQPRQLPNRIRSSQKKRRNDRAAKARRQHELQQALIRQKKIRAAAAMAAVAAAAAAAQRERMKRTLINSQQ